MPAVGLAALVLIAFANSPPDAFIYDSESIIEDHPLLRPESSWWRLLIKTYWGDDQGGGLYRPLTMLTYRFEQQALGFDTAAAHGVVNIALHLTVVLLLWRLALQWTRDGTAAFAAAALFAVHPVATEVVPNLVGRADLLATIGVMAALLAWNRADEAPSASAARRWIAAAALAWMLGLFSKESAISFPAIALAGDALREQARLFGSVRTFVAMRCRRYVALAMPLTLFLAIYITIVRAGPPNLITYLDNPLAHEPVTTRVFTSAKVFAIAVRQCVLPAWMSADYSADQIPLARGLGDPLALLGVVFAAGLAWAAWRLRGCYLAAAFGFAFFAIAYLPTSNLLFPIGTIFAERLLYLPLVGLALAVGSGGVQLWLAAGGRRSTASTAGAAFVLAAAVVPLSAQAVHRNAVWSTEAVLFTRTARDAPRSVRVQGILARLAAEADDTPATLDAAVAHADAAWSLSRGMPEWARSRQAVDAAATRIDRAGHLETIGQLQRAHDDLQAAVTFLEDARRLRDSPGPRAPYIARMAAWRAARGLPRLEESDSDFVIDSNRGKALYMLRDWAAAAEALARALAAHPGDAEVAAALGRALANAGRLEQAEHLLRQVAERSAGGAAPWLELAQVQLAARRLEEARASLDRAAAADPGSRQVNELRQRLESATAPPAAD